MIFNIQIDSIIKMPTDTEDDDSSYYGISDVEDNSQEDEAAIMVASNNIVNPLGFETESDDHSVSYIQIYNYHLN